MNIIWPSDFYLGLSESQMNIIAVYVSMYFEVDEGPNKNGFQARFSPQTACWESLFWDLLNFQHKQPKCY